MALAQAAGYALHLIVGALWTGSVLFVALGVVPVALRGDASVELFEYAIGRLTTISRLSAVVLLLTGLWQLSVLYPSVEALTAPPRGHLVLTMIVLWLVLAAVVEVGAARARAGLAERKIRTPAAEARPFLYAGAVVAVLVLLDAGLLVADARLGLF
jgi:uncharacterized membrane protein YuzA (DUF378 family)